MNETVLKNRSFLFMWIGSAISELGGAFGTFCNSILIYQLTGSKLALSSMWLLYFIPSLILQLVAGPFIDRWSRKWIMIVSQWTRGFVFLLPLIMLITDNMQTYYIFIVQIIVGLITPFYVPANQAILPTVVPKEQLQEANAYVDGTVRLMMFLAPVLGGMMIELAGVPFTLSLVCVFLFVSGSLLLFIKENRMVETIRKSWLHQFMEGWAYFFKQPIIVWLGFFLAFVQFGVGVTMVTNLPYVQDELGASYAAYGYFMAGFPLGYVIGSIIVGKMQYESRRTIMLGALVIGGLTYISLGLNENIYIAIFIEIIAGISLVFFNVHSMTIHQQIVPNELMGKIFSVRLFIIRSSMPLGILIGGICSEQFGVRVLYMIIGIIICTVSVLGIVLPYFKFLDQPVQNNFEKTKF
ncbi:permease [Bacillus manliponensis]|uniref:Permease n=1 Tax=Bacillus manliponensis TaxID=574376 RepID=A0A073KBD5_9BACI|nr:MFS transporter [Bacillus manliponensis]KEK19613.1 permease [Bacillus manliponensis]